MLDDPYPRAATLHGHPRVRTVGTVARRAARLLRRRASRCWTATTSRCAPVRPARGCRTLPDGSAKPHVSSHLVSCGTTPWGELRLTYLEGPSPSARSTGAVCWRRSSAPLWRALRSMPGVPRRPAVTPRRPAYAGHPDPDDLVALVLDVPRRSTGCRRVDPGAPRPGRQSPGGGRGGRVLVRGGGARRQAVRRVAPQGGGSRRRGPMAAASGFGAAVRLPGTTPGERGRGLLRRSVDRGRRAAVHAPGERPRGGHRGRGVRPRRSLLGRRGLRRRGCAPGARHAGVGRPRPGGAQLSARGGRPAPAGAVGAGDLHVPEGRRSDADVQGIGAVGWRDDSPDASEGAVRGEWRAPPRVRHP